MKFVGTIKGKPYLIDPETFEAEIREKIAKQLDDTRLPINAIQFNQAMMMAAKIARGEI